MYGQPEVINPDDYKPDNPTAGDMDAVTRRANVIVGIIKVIGVVVSVISLMLIGIKYVMGSASEKAEYKTSMIPYLIGTIFFFGLTQIIGFIYDFTSSSLN